MDEYDLYKSQFDEIVNRQLEKLIAPFRVENQALRTRLAVVQEAIELYLMDHRDRCRPCTARFEAALKGEEKPVAKSEVEEYTCPTCHGRGTVYSQREGATPNPEPEKWFLELKTAVNEHLKTAPPEQIKEELRKAGWVEDTPNLEMVMVRREDLKRITKYFDRAKPLGYGKIISQQELDSNNRLKAALKEDER